MRAVILAGGKGQRLHPYTAVFPKPLMPVGDLPILEVVVRQLRRAGCERITMAVGHLAELVMSFFGDGARFGIAIDYSREETPLGTAGPLRLIDDLPERFLVMNGDLLTTLDYRWLLETHVATGAMATIAGQSREVAVDLGVLRCDDAGRLLDYDEKPRLRYDVSMGVYVFQRDALRWLPPQGPMDFPDLILTLLREKQAVRVARSDALWLDIGRPEDYARAAEMFETHRAQFLGDEA